jgi:hypothetical protein
MIAAKTFSTKELHVNEEMIEVSQKCLPGINDLQSVSLKYSPVKTYTQYAKTRRLVIHVPSYGTLPTGPEVSQP